MESGFYRLMQEEARQSVEAETRAKVEAEIRAKVEAKIRAEIEAKTLAKFITEMDETWTKEYQQATHKVAVKSILTVLDMRFQSILVQCLKPAIEQIDDLQQIRQLLLQAVSAPSLEAFAETLVQNGNN